MYQIIHNMETLNNIRISEPIRSHITIYLTFSQQKPLENEKTTIGTLPGLLHKFLILFKIMSFPFHINVTVLHIFLLRNGRSPVI